MLTPTVLPLTIWYTPVPRFGDTSSYSGILQNFRFHFEWYNFPPFMMWRRLLCCHFFKFKICFLELHYIYRKTISKLKRNPIYIFQDIYSFVTNILHQWLHLFQLVNWYTLSYFIVPIEVHCFNFEILWLMTTSFWCVSITRVSHFPYKS